MSNKITKIYKRSADTSSAIWKTAVLSITWNSITFYKAVEICLEHTEMHVFKYSVALSTDWRSNFTVTAWWRFV